MRFNKLIQVIIFLSNTIGCVAQAYQIEDLRIALSRGKCFQATVHIDNSTILNIGKNQSYYGTVSNQDPQSAFEISAYPQGQQPSSHNRLSIVGYNRNGGHQEIAVTYQGKSSVFYPDKIRSSTSPHGYFFELGNSNANIVEQLIDNELIKIDVTEVTCNHPQATAVTAPAPQHTTIVYVPVPKPAPAHPTNSNAGCPELHDAIVGVSGKLYDWHEEDKQSAWVRSTTKMIYALPGGCIDRDREINKLYQVAKILYPKSYEDDKRNSWFKTTMQKSFDRHSYYTQRNIGVKIDEIINESKEIFDWHDDHKRIKWVTKKIHQLFE